MTCVQILSIREEEYVESLKSFGLRDFIIGYIIGICTSTLNTPSGCNLHSRCNECIEKCKDERPLLKNIL